MEPLLLTSWEELATPFDLILSVFLPCWPRLHTGILFVCLFSMNPVKGRQLTDLSGVSKPCTEQHGQLALFAPWGLSLG